MKVLCDVHISHKVVRHFQKCGIEALHVNDLPNSCFTPDPEIARLADEGGWIVVSKDADFEFSHLLKKSPRHLLRIALGNISTRELIDLLDQNLAQIRGAFASEQPCFVELGPSHLWIKGND